MARYIDAEKLPTYWECFDDSDEDYEYVLKADIDSAPAADVIPVAYIEEQIQICEAVPASMCARVLRFLLTSYKKEMDGEKMFDKIKKIDPKEWQGRYCIECVYAPDCAGFGVMKNACTGFEPRIRKDGRESV